MVSERLVPDILELACSFLFGVLFFSITLGRSYLLKGGEHLVLRLALVNEESI